MSQLSNRFQITNFVGMSSAVYSPVIAPFHGVRKVVIRNINSSGGSTISIATETASPPQSYTLAAQAEFTIDLNTFYPGGGPEPWPFGEEICRIKGAGSQPVILFYGGLVR